MQCVRFVVMDFDAVFKCSVLVLLSTCIGFANSNHEIEFGGRNHVVIASQILRPRSQFGIAVHVFENPASLLVLDRRSFRFYATISVNGSDLVTHQQKLSWNCPHVAYFITPAVIVPSVHELHVLGVNDEDDSVIFEERSVLVLDNAFVSVVFQTTRPIYRAGQTVRFRILILETTLLPFNDVMDIFVLDPDGFVMKRWLSVYSNNGVVSLKFKLPRIAKNGVWKIRSKIDCQVNEKSLIVETYYQPLFEVIVSSPPYITDTEEKIIATIYGLYPSQKHVCGNATIVWSARKLSELSNFTKVHTNSLLIKERKHEIALPMASILNVFEDLSGIEVKILVDVREYMSGETVSGFSHTRIITSNIIVKFLSESPMVFTPGTQLHGHVAVLYEDNERVPVEILRNSVLRVEIISDVNFPDGRHVSEIEVTEPNYAELKQFDLFDMLLRNDLRQRFLDTGVLSFHFDVPRDASQILMKAVFTNNDFRIETSIDVIKKYFTNDEYIKLWTTSDDLLVGDYATFHVVSNFLFDVFYILILSNGMVLRIREYRVPTSTSLLVTFSEPVSSDMAPWFHLIVYCISKTNYEIRADVVTVPVNGFARYDTTLTINTGKDFRNEHVELIFNGAEGAFIGVQAVRSMVYHLQGGHELTQSKVTDSFLRFEGSHKMITKLEWISRTGLQPTKSVYFLSQDYAFDSYSVFSLNRLSVMTNMNVSTLPEHRGCSKTDPLSHCSTSNCSLRPDLCDPVSCIYDHCDVSYQSRENYFLKRINWNSFIFDVEDGDWAFREIKKNDHAGDEFEIVTSPQTADDWYFSAFNMDMVYGFSMINEPVVFSSKRPLMVHVLGPHQCHCGEQLGLKLNVHNFDTNQMLVMIKLLGSDDYKFVQVDEGGFVASYNARLLSGDYEMLIYMNPESEEEIHFPVKPVIEQGPVEIQFHVESQAGRQFLSHMVTVMGEGALINRHTSTTLDLKNRGLVLQYLDIVVEESPIVPYEHYRRYVFGSPLANLAITNTVIGPVINKGVLNMNMLLKRESKGAMDLLFELHANIWTLHYLRYTNQLRRMTVKETLYECNTLYAEAMRYYHKDGWFSHWETSLDRPSVWLTAWAVRIFNDARYPDWEFQFWIDPSVFLGMFHWLLARQDNDGKFIETERAPPFDSQFSRNAAEESAALTAHVLLSLHSAAQNINNKLRTSVVVACLKARMLLERLLQTVHDPHLIAMIAYILSITGSSVHIVAFTKLQGHMRINGDGLNYWSRKMIPENPKSIENQKPYRKPRTYSDAVSGAVEATSWALLTHLAHDGVTPLVENIVEWLVSMRMTNCGFTSIVDTAVAYRALTEFAFRSRILDITHINVKVETVASEMFSQRVHIDNQSVAAFHFRVPKVWGNINLDAKGSGVAFVQLDVDYGIDDERFLDTPLVNTFDLDISEFYSYYRNKSVIIIQSCLRYNSTASNVSGAAILEIQTPTGYHILESDAIEVVKAGVHPNLKDTRTVEGKTYWFFDFLDKELHCFNYTIKRWYPVANVTLYRSALLYEITARERFVQVLINSTQLYLLSICEVCGSFQCPYCPHYNSAINSTSMTNELLFIIIFTFFVEFIY